MKLIATGGGGERRWDLKVGQFFHTNVGGGKALWSTKESNIHPKRGVAEAQIRLKAQEGDRRWAWE